MSGLPETWEAAPLDALCDFNPKHHPDTPRETIVSFVPMHSVSEVSGSIVETKDRPLSEVWKGYTHFQDGDVLFAKITPCMENGKAAVAQGLSNGLGCGSTEFHVLRPAQAIDPIYVWHFLRQKTYRKDAEQAMTGAVGQRRVPVNYVKASLLPTAPTNEQRRIVEKVDSLLSRSTRARDELGHIPRLIERYKQAVLTKAFRGDLTADWRHRNAIPADDSETLHQERRLQREQHAMRGKGRNRSKHAPVSDLPALPAEWRWITFDDCSWDLTVGHVGSMKNRYVSDGIPFLRSLNVKPNMISTKDLAYIDSVFFAELKKSQLSPGDLVVVRTGEPGTAAVIPENIPISNCSDLVICRLVDAVLPDYAAYYMNSEFAKQTVSGMRVGIAQQHFNVGAMSNMPLPLPSLQEQREVLKRIEKANAWIDRIAHEHDNAAHLLSNLDQAVLAKAFRGELVPQDPGDEPASVLLEHIRAERAKQPKVKHRRGRKKKEATV